MKINRAFWIKLARLAAICDTLEENRVKLHEFMVTSRFADMPKETQTILINVHGLLCDLASLE